MDDLRRLAADLNRLRTEVIPRTRLAVAQSGEALKEAMRAKASESRHFKLAGLITAETRWGGLSVEVGPEKRGAGNLGAIAYFGGVNGGGGTIDDPQKALEAEAEVLERRLSEWIKL